MEIYLVRHTSVNVDKGVCYGQSDVDILKESFGKDVKRIKDKLPSLSRFTIYSSDLKRCKLLAETLNCTKIIFDERLRELNFGKWELQAWNSIAGNQLKEWMEDYINIKTPGGESYNDLHKRTIIFWQDLIKNKYQKAIVITHGGVIHSILSYILHIPLINSFKIKIDTGSVSKILISNEYESIEFINK